MAEDSSTRWKIIPKRRHSIQTVNPLKGELEEHASPCMEDEEQRQIVQCKQPTRRQSIAESLHSMTKSVSNSLQKAMHLGNSNHLSDDKNKLNKHFFKEIFAKYFNQPELKILKCNVRGLSEADCVQHYPTSTVTDLLMNFEFMQGSQNGEEDYIDPKSLYYGAIYEAEVIFKHPGPKGTVRRKLDLVAKCHPRQKRDQNTIKGQEEASFHLGEDEETPKKSTTQEEELTACEERLWEAERDYKAHSTVVYDMKCYLRKKGVQHPEDYLSLPLRFRTDQVSQVFRLSDVNEATASLNQEENRIEDDLEAFYKNLFLIQDLYASGYRMADVGPDENGLDFTHSLLATAKLASFHAVSYCMRKEEDADFLTRYPFLNEDPVYRPATQQLFTRAQNTLSQRLHSIIERQTESELGVCVTPDQSQYFEEAVSHLFEYQSTFVDPRKTEDKFNVLCHGDLWMQNVGFSYGSCMESQSDVVDIRFDDLHHARFASCATDIHNLFYYTVDSDVRRDHTVNLLAVYHDHFVKTAKSLSPGLVVFSQSELLMEFHRLLKFGFLEGLTLFSTAYETQLRKKAAKDQKLLDPQDSTWSGSAAKVSGPKFSDYRDTVLSLMADVSRFKFQGVNPGAPIGIQMQKHTTPTCQQQPGLAEKSTEKVLINTN